MGGPLWMERWTKMESNILSVWSGLTIFFDFNIGEQYVRRCWGMSVNQKNVWSKLGCVMMLFLAMWESVELLILWVFGGFNQPFYFGGKISHKWENKNKSNILLHIPFFSENNSQNLEKSLKKISPTFLFGLVWGAFYVLAF